ncbi:hypothetical protein QVD17_20472 [Tagetes erecta]|uniref:Uncharacterized protein n=1 Tax=Tagetes erecta TaxID=13708 RepID=A0AAD8KRQ2_TARER|nr:hypothetical protein QVD17_20472 [Tagetes erecta]
MYIIIYVDIILTLRIAFYHIAYLNKVVVGRTLTRNVGKALVRHSNKQMGKWRKALKDAANLSGWELKNTAHGYV